MSRFSNFRLIWTLIRSYFEWRKNHFLLIENIFFDKNIFRIFPNIFDSDSRTFSNVRNLERFGSNSSENFRLRGGFVVLVFEWWILLNWLKLEEKGSKTWRERFWNLKRKVLKRFLPSTSWLKVESSFQLTLMKCMYPRKRIFASESRRRFSSSNEREKTLEF